MADHQAQTVQLETTLPPANCLGCGSSRLVQRPLMSERHHLSCCLHCGMACTWPTPGSAELEACYTATYYGPQNVKFVSPMEKIIGWLSRNRARRLHRLLQRSGRILEVGCGRGLVLQELSRLHHDCFGTERSPLAAARALQIPGVKIFSRPLEDCLFPAGSFDLILLWHVLEHLDSPDGVLREISRILKPGGYLILEVPNLSSLQSSIFGKHWFHLDIPRHLYHFTSGGLCHLLKRNGFSITRTTTFSLEQGPFGVLQSLLNSLFRQDNILYGILKQELRPQLRQRLLHLCLGTVFVLPAFAFAVGESWLGRGAVIQLESCKLK